ncbi:MAG: hypothetical protein M1819_003299 [Sarea resinae]|nr:MAG: hypothetical protein M1819_003299 [Sarea resinae]
MATQIAWIGLGNMGRGMCTNLVEKGNLTKPVLIFNRTKKRAEDLSSKLPSGKSVVADSVEEAVAKSDIIFSCVGDDAALTGIIDKAVTENLEGKLFVECSTVHPDTTAKVAETVHKKGAFFVASPGKHRQKPSD